MLQAAPALPVDECLLWHNGTKHPGLSNFAPKAHAQSLQSKEQWGY